ncbi:MAG: SDR family NAD-dependent epimerase/dehydratase, partial [Candidatus Aminicenantes bacterium]|nr:SDR family NAD-dependent epimerase/dehydratase [Candidatus Aminicenantes bacterium]
PMNLGNSAEFTIIELAELVLKLTQSRSKIDRRPLPEDDPVRRCPDIAAAKAKLGWEPRVGLEEGLALTVDYFRRTLGGNG